MLETTIMISLVIGITEVFKRAILIPKKLIPLVALSLGIGLSILFRGELPVIEAVFVGLVVGLSASGLYSGTKTSIKG